MNFSPLLSASTRSTSQILIKVKLEYSIKMRKILEKEAMITKILNHKGSVKKDWAWGVGFSVCFKLPIERRSTNKGKNSFFILWNVHRQLMCLLLLSSHPLIVYKTGSLVAKEETDHVGSNHKGISYKTAERFRLIFVNFRWESLAEESLFTFLLFRACDLGGTEIACSCMLIYRVNSTHRKWKSSLRFFFHTLVF